MRQRIVEEIAGATFTALEYAPKDGHVREEKDPNKPLTGAALIKETCRRIRAARSYWDAHNNRACRGEREKALELYNLLSDADRDKVPQVLRVWLRYRSEKYFGDDRTPPESRKTS